MTSEFLDKIVEKLSFLNASQTREKLCALEDLYMEQLEKERKRDLERTLTLIKAHMDFALEAHQQEIVVEIRSIENSITYKRMETEVDSSDKFIKKEKLQTFEYDILKDEIYWEILENLVVTLLKKMGYEVEIINNNIPGHPKTKISWYLTNQKETNHGS